MPNGAILGNIEFYCLSSYKNREKERERAMQEEKSKGGKRANHTHTHSKQHIKTERVGMRHKSVCACAAKTLVTTTKK